MSQNYDNELLNHQQNLMAQMDAHNVNILSDEELYAQQQSLEDAQIQSNSREPFSKFVIASKRDLINQMLVKSKGIIFNF